MWTAALEACSETLILVTNSAFALGPRKPVQTRVDRSQKIPDACSRQQYDPDNSLPPSVTAVCRDVQMCFTKIFTVCLVPVNYNAT